MECDRNDIPLQKMKNGSQKMLKEIKLSLSAKFWMFLVNLIYKYNFLSAAKRVLSCFCAG